MNAASNVLTTAVSAPAAKLAKVLVLYALAEAQAGHATRIDVLAEGHTFGVSDDGRGHSIDKKIDGTHYLTFIYSQFEFPFASPQPGAVQLQGIGMSLLNSLCSSLEVTVTRADQRLRLFFESGVLMSQHREPAVGAGTGNRIVGSVMTHEEASVAVSQALAEWLTGLLHCVPTVCVTLNGQALLDSARSH